MSRTVWHLFDKSGRIQVTRQSHQALHVYSATRSQYLHSSHVLTRVFACGRPEPTERRIAMPAPVCRRRIRQWRRMQRVGDVGRRQVGWRSGEVGRRVARSQGARFTRKSYIYIYIYILYVKKRMFRDSSSRPVIIVPL